jgi:hypothetical protein
VSELSSPEPSCPVPSPPSPPDSAAARWAERLARFSAGGQSVAAFCAAEGVPTSKFYHWKNRLARPVPPPAPRTPAVVPLRVAPPHPAPIELVLPSGLVLRLPGDTRPEVLVAVLRGLESPC